jgi:hypothetical protein
MQLVTATPRGDTDERDRMIMQVRLWASMRMQTVVGRLYTSNPVVHVESHPYLESAWSQPLSLSSENLVSKFAFSNAS